MREKTNAWGLKVFLLGVASAIIYRSLMYQGSNTLSVKLLEKYSVINSRRIYLSNRISHHLGQKLYRRKHFISLLLLQELLKESIFTAGIKRKKLFQKCQLKAE